MSKLSFSNEDQCPAQCNENYQKTQNVVGVQKRMINMLGSVINETDDLIQSLSSSAFGDDLTKYQEISSLARKLSTVFSKLPWVNKEIGKMIMKMIKMEKEEYNSDFGDDDDFDDDDDDEDHSRPWPKPGPNRPRPNHLKYSLPNKRKLRYHYISLLFQTTTRQGDKIHISLLLTFLQFEAMAPFLFLSTMVWENNVGKKDVTERKLKLCARNQWKLQIKENLQ